MRAAVLVLSLLLVGCANLSLNDVYRNPSFQYQSTRISDVSFQQLNGASTVSISNPNPYQLPISSMTAELWLEGSPWLDLSNQAVGGLSASSATTVTFDWAFVFDDLLRRAADVYAAGEANFVIKLAPTFEVPLLGAQTVSWSSDFTVPVPKLPTVSLKSWQLSSVSLTKVTLAMDVLVSNPNVFGVQTRGIKLDVGTSTSNSIAQLALADSNLAASGQSQQRVELSLSIIDAGLSVVSALKSGQWPDALAMNWQGDWRSPDLDFALPALSGRVK